MRPLIKLPSRKVEVGERANSLCHLLIEAVGPYCAYCESPVTNDFPFSRRVSISTTQVPFKFGSASFRYSTGVGSRRFSHAWVNLQVACSACAAAQGDEPGSRAGFERMQAQPNKPEWFNRLTGVTGRLRLSDDELDDLYIQALGSWVWPDVSSDENGLIVLPGDDTWNLLTFDNSPKRQVDLAGEGLLRLDPTEWSAPWATQAQTKVWVIPNQTFISQQSNSLDLLSRVKRTISGWNLNYCNPTAPTSPDRRVENRTAALAIVDAALNHLTAVVSQVAGQSKGDQDLEHLLVMELAGFIRETLRSVGFWSLWAQRFLWKIGNPKDTNSTPPPPWNLYSGTARRLLLYQLFAEYEIDHRNPQIQVPLPMEKPWGPKEEIEGEEDIDSQMVLPGTDLGRLPF